LLFGTILTDNCCLYLADYTNGHPYGMMCTSVFRLSVMYAFGLNGISYGGWRWYHSIGVVTFL